MSGRDSGQGLPLWRRELDELLETHLAESAEPECPQEGAFALGPTLRNVYQMARMAMLDLMLDEGGDDAIDVEASREFVEVNAMRVVGFVSLQLADSCPSLARVLLGSVNDSFRESVHQIAERVADELLSTGGSR
jgi:hypothetical protein